MTSPVIDPCAAIQAPASIAAEDNERVPGANMLP